MKPNCSSNLVIEMIDKLSLFEVLLKFDKNNVGLYNRNIIVPKNRWRYQYHAGINELLGIIIMYGE